MANFIKLTRFTFSAITPHDDGSVLVNLDHVAEITPDKKGAVLWEKLGGTENYLAVKEDLATVQRLIEEAKGRG